jgi:N-methylhydantoinase A/oxoprolinase/acetone carboxylase beta subunit/N-methylhydantoinase B/oxoprolinase/acetone carboxylase alpha subunit
MASHPRWQFWIDRGGTFTDVIAKDPEGELHVSKLLSQDPEHYEDAALEGIRRFLGGDLDPSKIEAVRLGTTVATNALLERRGARIGLVTTAGFEDLLEIGTQARPDLFALEIRKAQPLAWRILGVAEEVSARGELIRSVGINALRPKLEAWRADGVEALAVVFKNAYVNDTNEQAIGALARELGFETVALSHRSGGEIGMTARGDTTAADAYLSPVLRAYVDRLQGALRGDLRLRFMQSSGGLAHADHFSGKDAVLSGPAGGVVAALHLARQARLDQVIAFDMGGTSTDVSRIDSRSGLERTYERVIAGVRLQAPSLAVSTIASGGGSCVTFDGRRLRVGPDSAGADPGPVCYRRPGGRLAITDANALLGRVQPQAFPTCFGPGADAPLDVDAARGGFAELLHQLAEADSASAPRSVEALAAGVVRIANEAMAAAIREISVAQGHDLGEHTLLCFGGAGAQHACAVADMLGVPSVLVPPRGGVLSAWGIGLAPLAHSGVRPVMAPYTRSGALEEGFLELEREGARALKAQGAKPKVMHSVRSADLRYSGVDAAITIREPSSESTIGWIDTFARAHRRLYGFDRPGHGVEVVNLRVETIGAKKPKRRARKRKPEPDACSPGEPQARAEVWFDPLVEGARRLEAFETPIFQRSVLTPGTLILGPALIAEEGATVVVDPDWEARVDSQGNLRLEAARVSASDAAPEQPELVDADPDLVEAFDELARCLLEGLDTLDEETATLVLEQGAGLGLADAAARAVLRAAAGAQGVLLPADLAAGAGADPELVEAFDELVRCLLEGVESIDDLTLESLLEQGEGMGLSRRASELALAAGARAMGVALPQGLEVAVDSPREQIEAACDPVQLEIMANLYMSVAEQMGATLRRVSLSVNIKERLDFSCAVFDGEGRLVANAPHIPVHLGAMSESVRAVLESRGEDLQPGDVLLTNDPYHGGSHLPDVTVITPVFVGGSRVFFVANRGHHADIGGIVPGSMPPFSRSIQEEGVRLHDVLVVRDGRFRRAELRELLAAGDPPVRGIEERIADLEAQVAANAQGVQLLGELVGRYGLSAVSAYMGHVQRDAAAALREAIAELPDGEHRFVDYLDEGARIEVCVTIDGEAARVDFTGTDPQLPGNLNAPRAVVLAAVLYVFRTLTRRPIPLNAGCFDPLEVIIPAAVVGGNVETSQRLVDVLYGALGKLGASQGTMNNLTFGDASFGYYETICGGAGAGLGFDGASAVHTHMTNTRITDPEVLERRYPVRLRRFSIRRGSGGAGVWSGGAGVERAIEFRAPCSAAILSERRALGPWGAHGAGSGVPGRNRLVRGGISRDLPGKVQIQVEPGDVLVVETPGGGGYAPSSHEWSSLSGAQARALFRADRARRTTSGVAMRHVQANLIVLPRAVADDFAQFCTLNPGPCPLLERLDPGAYTSLFLAPGADLRQDLPLYRIHTRDGYEEVPNLLQRWSGDHVAFLLGCSFTAESALSTAGLPLRHVEQGRVVPMYRTQRRVRPVGPFQGHLVVSMRPMPRYSASSATALTAPLWHSHGGPVHIGDTQALGIPALSAPDWGQSVQPSPGDVPLFWACGVTSQEVLHSALSEGVITEAFSHAPGHMFIADLSATDVGSPRS